MQLLLDENISFRLIKKIEQVYPGVKHVSEYKLINIHDVTIFEFAKNNSLSIVTFDEDFNNLSVIRGYPPKIVWIRTGNTSTSLLAELLISKKETIRKFLAEKQNEFGCLEIY